MVGRIQWAIDWNFDPWTVFDMSGMMIPRSPYPAARRRGKPLGEGNAGVSGGAIQTICGRGKVLSDRL
jgi:hypothetical protein